MRNIKSWLGKNVRVIIDRPMGSKHPDYQTKYPINYGYLPETKSGIDQEEIDAYILGQDSAIKEFKGIVIAVIDRLNGEIKLIVTDGRMYSAKEIRKQIYFQERFHQSRLIK